jgi:DNA-binding XRE family transcriptional regulator
MLTKSLNEKDFYIRLGRQIKDYRNKKQFTQDQLAQLSNLKRTSITNIEKGNQKTPLHVVVAICYALEIELSDLIPSVEKLFGAKSTQVEYIQIGATSKPVSKSMADVVTRIAKDL